MSTQEMSMDKRDHEGVALLRAALKDADERSDWEAEVHLTAALGTALLLQAVADAIRDADSNISDAIR